MVHENTRDNCPSEFLNFVDLGLTYRNVIKAIVLNENCKAVRILLPHMPIVPTDPPISFKRLQFHIRLFAITINKA